MGVAELREAFNAVGEPAGFVAQRAFLTNERAQDIEWQRLAFHGTGPDGEAFVVESVRLRPGYDPVIGARETAQTMIDEYAAAQAKGLETALAKEKDTPA